MDQKFLSLTPKRFLCPYCGKWHKWTKKHELGYYSKDLSAKLYCYDAPPFCDEGDYKVYFYNGYCYFSIDSMCKKANQSIKGKIPIADIIESIDEPIVTFEVPFVAENPVGKSECIFCDYSQECLYAKLGEKGDNRHMNITFGFEFKQSEYDVILALKKQSFIDNKEDNSIMQNNNIFQMEFGPNKDNRIASTVMGIAVKKDDNSWLIFDRKKKELTDIGDIKIESFPIFIMPTTKLEEGDLIKDSGEYYFVTKVATSVEPTQTISVKTGEVKNIIPVKNILGISVYSKVIATGDSLNESNDVDVEKLILMSALCGQNSENSNNQMNMILQLMLLKGNLNEEDDTIKLLLMSSMTGSNSDNPLMNYLMLKSLIDNKEDKTN